MVTTAWMAVEAMTAGREDGEGMNRATGSFSGLHNIKGYSGSKSWNNP